MDRGHQSTIWCVCVCPSLEYQGEPPPVLPTVNNQVSPAWATRGLHWTRRGRDRGRGRKAQHWCWGWESLGGGEVLPGHTCQPDLETRSTCTCYIAPLIGSQYQVHVYTFQKEYVDGLPHGLDQITAQFLCFVFLEDKPHIFIILLNFSKMNG